MESMIRLLEAETEMLAQTGIYRHLSGMLHPTHNFDYEKRNDRHYVSVDVTHDGSTYTHRFDGSAVDCVIGHALNVVARATPRGYPLPRMERITLDTLRDYVKGHYTYRVERIIALIDNIEVHAETDEDYRQKVKMWLTRSLDLNAPVSGGCTVFLRDVLCDRFKAGTTTQWHNTWIPIDTSLHNLRWGIV